MAEIWMLEDEMARREVITAHLAELDRLDDPFVQAVVEFERAALLLDLEDWMVERLRHCERECTAHLPQVRDDGRPVTVTSHEAVHHTVYPFSLAKLEVKPNGSQSELRARGMRMSWTCALMRVAASGAGIVLGCAIKEQSERELRQLTRALGPLLRARRAAGAVMVGTGANNYVLAWLEQECAGSAVRVLHGTAVEAACHCEAATQWIVRALRASRREVEGARIAVQGCGRKALDVAELLVEHGAKLVALADASGGVMDRQGLDLKAVGKHLAREGMLLGYGEGEPISNADVLEAECEALILGEGTSQMKAGNANSTRAAVVAELEQDAITSEALQLLTKKSEVIPQWMMDAGMVVAAVLQTNDRMETPLRTARAVVRRAIGYAWQEMEKARRRWNVPVHEAAELVAVEKVAGVLRLQREG